MIDDFSFDPLVLVAAIRGAVYADDADFLHRAALAIEAGTASEPWIGGKGVAPETAA